MEIQVTRTGDASKQDARPGWVYGDDCELWVIAREFRRIPQRINRPLTVSDDSIPLCVLVEPISQMGDHGHIVALACQARLQRAHR